MARTMLFTEIWSNQVRMAWAVIGSWHPPGVFSSIQKLRHWKHILTKDQLHIKSSVKLPLSLSSVDYSCECHSQARWTLAQTVGPLLLFVTLKLFPSLWNATLAFENILDNFLPLVTEVELCPIHSHMTPHDHLCFSPLPIPPQPPGPCVLSPHINNPQDS